jgi:hypothetical protein
MLEVFASNMIKKTQAFNTKCDIMVNKNLICNMIPDSSFFNLWWITKKYPNNGSNQV